MKVLLGLVLVSSYAVAQPKNLGESHDHLSLEAIPTVYQPNLIGGVPATAEDYPGVFYTRQGNSRCTGTVIGSRVVATAAHCVSNGGSLALTYEGNTYSGRCTHASEYNGNSTADWALCLLSNPIPDAIGESINTEASRLNRGDDLILMGFGCIYSGGSGGNDGVLRTGSAPITSLPSGRDYDIITSGSSALCYGDSGGPSFVIDSETGLRYQTGINSRGDIRRTSYLSSLHNETVLEFYNNWADQNNVRICGLHADAAGCLQSPIDIPEECDNVASHLDTVEACTMGTMLPTADECDTALISIGACVDARQNSK